jgi:hypothetical protein
MTQQRITKIPTRYLKIRGACTAERGHSGNSIDLCALQQITLNNKNKNYTISTED